MNSSCYLTYTGQPLNVKGTFRTSHLRKLNKQGIWIEFEIDVCEGWNNMFIHFPTESIIDSFIGRPYASKKLLSDGIYPSNSSRMVLVSRQGVVSELSEKEMAKVLFSKLI